jgi:hypothetical protein
VSPVDGKARVLKKPCFDSDGARAKQVKKALQQRQNALYGVNNCGGGTRVAVRRHAYGAEASVTSHPQVLLRYAAKRRCAGGCEYVTRWTGAYLFRPVPGASATWQPHKRQQRFMARG